MSDYPEFRVAPPTEYACDTNALAAHVAGITVLPNVVERFSDGYRLWHDWNIVKDRAAIRHAHCIVGCLDAPLDDHRGTA